VLPVVAAVDKENARVVALVSDTSSNNLVDGPDGGHFVPVVSRYLLVRRRLRGVAVEVRLHRHFLTQRVEVLLLEVYFGVVDQQVGHSDYEAGARQVV